MKGDRDDRVRCVYAQLKALADNVPDFVFERDVERYHELLDELQSLGWRIDGFRIDAAKDMFRPVSSWNERTGEKMYLDSIQVRHGVFDRQVKALLTYFELSQSASHVSVALPRIAGR